MRFASALSQHTAIEAALEETTTALKSDLDQAPDLAVVFLSAHHLAGVETASRALSREWPEALVLGCTAASVIGGGLEVEESPGLSIVAGRLPGVSLHPFEIADADLAGPEAWQKRIAAPVEGTKGFVLLGDPFSGDAEAVIGGIGAAYPGCVQVGGLASGAAEPGGHRLLLGDRVLDGGVVGVGLSGDVSLDTIVAQGCRPIGQPMFVTRCRENLLLEVDGRPPAQVLETLYEEGDARERALFQGSLFLGIQMDAQKMELERGDFLVRNILGGDPESGALAVGAMLEEAAVVQFQLRDAHTAAEDLDLRLGAYVQDSSSGPDPRGALLFSCLGRGRQMYGVPNHDSDSLRRHLQDLPMAGFFGNGEIGPIEGRTFLHGYTSAFGIFRPA